MLNNNQYPFVLLLTHRRGIGILVCKNSTFLNSPELNYSNLFTQIKNQNSYFFKNEIFEFIDFNNVTCARAIGKTAENLFALYQESLEKAELKPHEIKTLIIGVGPGSFTGLRLGCSFVNGIKIATPELNLLPVTSTLTNELLEICKIYQCEEECKKQLEEYQIDDESTGYITFFDLIICLLTAKDENRKFVEFLVPEYGRDPSPVIKLREGIIQ